MFTPAPVKYEEDKLRWEYFNDHPWELARPRVVLEKDGRDGEKWGWGVGLDVAVVKPRGQLGEWEGIVKSQAGRPVNGEA